MEAIKVIRYCEEKEKKKYRKVKFRYFDLQNKACDLSDSAENIHQLVEAEKYLRRALKLTDKNPYARASAYHDFGVLYFTHFSMFPGGLTTNLRKAESYFKRALDSSKRKEFPDDYASSLSQLGATYRRAAMDPLWHQSPDECLSKAEQLHNRALKVLSNSLPKFIRLNQSSVVYFNLASVMFDTGREVDGCDIQATACECYLEALSIASHGPLITQLKIKPRQILPLTFARLNYFSDKQKHKKLCEKIKNICPRLGIDPLSLELTNPISDIANPRHEIMVLVHRALNNYSLEHINALKRKLSSLMEVRRATSTDQESDSVGVLIQQACSGLARILSKNEQALRAFAELENVSAMRFCESAANHWNIPENRVANALRLNQGILGSTYYRLNEWPLLFKDDTPATIQIKLRESIDNFICTKNDRAHLHQDISKKKYETKYLKTIEIASKHDDPVEFLSGTATKCLNDIKKIESNVNRLDPSFAERSKRDNSIKEDDIKLALRHHPELTVIKIDIEDGYSDALFLVAYIDNSKVIVKSVLIDLPKQIINQVAEMINGGNRNCEDWELDFVDWEDILPANCKSVGLLPSFFASHIPWIATGTIGNRLFEFVDEVNWIPSVMYLYKNSKYLNAKCGTYKAQGGNTLFEEFAEHSLLTGDENCSKSSLISKVNDAEIFTYYGHCEHQYPHRPLLLFRDYKITDLELSDSVRGAERIELWACQSGSNIPLHILASNVNEAFGMDMRMLEWGAKTAIGTLWAVPEFVTAHIKNRYELFLCDGMPASAALLSAQRWWITEGADKVLEEIKIIGKTGYLESLNYNCTDGKTMEALLGPVLSSNRKIDTLDFDQLMKEFKHPSSWAGIRFCGIKTAKRTYINKEKLELNSEDKSFLSNLITEMALESGFVE